MYLVYMYGVCMCNVYASVGVFQGVLDLRFVRVSGLKFQIF